ncbi:uncharacterized protein LOC100835292 isoform X1 [Brachypodium distachyon]|uniref:Uncharacterized protein n=1 Tax=Brachypodium distachyon TaxID=15368 RepID=I1GPP0_BRADI|nr:uncharacterized protein LOC100835292 isoform X1 [Brachypodium distachyon]KQK13829.1 hypothetical protein BRADI_1g12740v3 [Brachypodium distachyon]|eukprot:XP_003561410.2 uncharacterized protein LOC100835292 isoform X1 [Brachypodium distachyon]
MATAAPGPASSCCAMRRSAGSSPFKPADCPHRSSSVSKSGGVCGCLASPRRSFGEKENEQQEKGARTPKARASGVKNFMAPTISATSKAVAASASPRKKVLGERNEQTHLLAPSSPRDLAHKPKGPPDAGPARRLRLSFDGAAPAPLATASEASYGGEDTRMENPACGNHHHVAADLVDAEPSQAAVYDPKTNYTSPRPRFLHYKPNPRIEMYRHGGSGVRRLEEGFSSESSEETDTTTTEEDELAEEEQKQVQQPKHLLEEPSPLASPSAVGDAAAVHSPEEPAPGSPMTPVPISEPTPTSPRARALAREPRAISPQARALTPELELGLSSGQAPAKRSLPRFLLAAGLILFMAAAFVSVPLPPDSPVMSNAALSKVTNFLSVQELHPVELAAWLKQWSSSSLDSITSYWEALAFRQEQEFFGPHFAANLSAASSADTDHGPDFYYNFAETISMPSEEPFGNKELKIQDFVSASNTVLTAEAEGDVVVEEESNDDDAVEEEAIDDDASYNYNVAKELDVEVISEEAPGSYGEVEELDEEIAEEAQASYGEEMASFSQNLNIPSQSTREPEQIENLEEQDVETDESEEDHANVKEEQEAYRASESDSSIWSGYLDKISKPAAVGVALAAVIVLSTGVAALYMRKKQVQVPTNANTPPSENLEQTAAQSGSGSSEVHLNKSSQFQSSKMEEPERFGNSGFSQYSSSLSSGHGKRRKAKEEESLSLEPMSKRESYSTSSYGSFTTYEKISAKKRNKEDEAMTPVRRSSRLRNVKAPEA